MTTSQRHDATGSYARTPTTTVVALMQPKLDAIYIGSEPVSSLTGLNDQLNDLFEVTR